MDQDELRADSPLMTMSNSFLGESGILSLSIPGPSRDSTYYISDGNTVLLVENTLFRVSSIGLLGCRLFHRIYRLMCGVCLVRFIGRP